MFKWMSLVTVKKNKYKHMKVSVWDTYVKREEGKLMHFDILVPDALNDEKIIFNLWC